MIKKILLTIGIFSAVIFGIAKADTINSLSPFQTHNNVIAPIVSSSSFQIPSLGSVGNPCTTVNASGTFATSTCGSGGSGSSTLIYASSGISATASGTNGYIIGNTGVTSFNGATGTVSFSGEVIDVKSYGAKGDAQIANDCTVVAGSTTITCASSHFSLADVGKSIGIPFAGASSSAALTQTLTSTIASFVSATSVVISNNPKLSISGPRVVTDGNQSAGSYTLTSASANFKQGDLGKIITVAGAAEVTSAGSAGDQPDLVYLVNSSTSVATNRVAATAVTSATVTIPGATIIWGTDDTSAIQSAITAACSSSIPVLLSNGRYLTSSSLVPCSNLNFNGNGDGNSIINSIGSNYATFEYMGAIGTTASTTASQLNNVTFNNFQIDDTGVEVNVLTTVNKAIYLLPTNNMTIENMYIHNCSATCIGVDYGVGERILNNFVQYAGDQALNNNDVIGGGAGIGLAIGNQVNEPITVTGNTVFDSGHRGIFIESESSGLTANGSRIENNDVEYAGNPGVANNPSCIGADGGFGAIISGNTVKYCNDGIETNNGLFSAEQPAQDFTIEGNFITNSLVGILSVNTNGGGLISGNTITGWGTNTPAATSLSTEGIEVDATGTMLGTVTVIGNKIHDIDGQPIVFPSGKYDALDVFSNDISSGGTLNGNSAAGITFSGTSATTTDIMENTVYNASPLSTVTGLISYGFSLTSGNIATLLVGENDFTRTSSGTISTAGGTVGTELGGQFPAGINTTSLTDSGITGTSQCVQANASGLFSGTGSACGSGGGSGGLGSSTPFLSGYLPLITPSGTLSNSTFFQQIPASSTFANIAFDASSGLVSSPASTTLTVSQTVSSTATNRMLIATLFATNATVSATYNGVAMTQVGIVTGTDTKQIGVFMLPNPATGTHNLIFTASSTEASFFGGGLSYSGVAQTTVPDGVATTTQQNLVTTFSSTVQTTNASDWAILVTKETGGFATGAVNATNTLVRISNSSTSPFDVAADNNGPVGSTGPYTQWLKDASTTGGGIAAWYAVQIAIAPAQTAVSSTDISVGTTTDLGANLGIQGSFRVNGTSTLNGNVSVGGHIGFTTSTPSVSSCGTNATSTGSDNGGKMTLGTGGITACTLTFATAWTVAPVCTVSDSSSTDVDEITTLNTSTLTLGFPLSIAGGSAWYICQGNPN